MISDEETLGDSTPVKAEDPPKPEESKKTGDGRSNSAIKDGVYFNGKLQDTNGYGLPKEGNKDKEEIYKQGNVGTSAFCV